MAFVGTLSEVERPSFSTQLARGLGAGISSGLGQTAQFAQQMALQKQKTSNLAKETKQLEKIKMMETGLGTIGRMRELIPSAGGWTSGPLNKISSLFPGETQKNRAELESLGRSLIPLVAAGVPVRNQREFAEYSKIITDPSSSGPQLEGALNAIQDILERSIGEDPEEKKISKKEKVRFSADNPEHRKKAEQLHRTYNDKEKVREILSREFEF